MSNYPYPREKSIRDIGPATRHSAEALEELVAETPKERWVSSKRRKLAQMEKYLDTASKAYYDNVRRDPGAEEEHFQRQMRFVHNRENEFRAQSAKRQELKMSGQGAYRSRRGNKGKRKMPSRTYKARQRRYKRKMPSRTYKARRWNSHRKYAYLKRFELNPRAVALAAMDIIDGDMTATQSSQASHSLPWFDSDQTSYRMKRSRLD
jgi:hypothetical protein